MTGNTETNASMNPSTSEKEKSPQTTGYTDEELEALIEDDVLIEMKCESCGYEEGVPEWILEEFLEIELSSGSKDRRYSCECPNCNKTMFRKELFSDTFLGTLK